MMHDMNPRSEFTAETNHHLYRLVLRCPRPCVQKRLVVFCCSLCSVFLNWTRHFSVNNQNSAQLRQHRHRLTEVCLRNIGKFIDTRMDQKAFETDYACAKQRLQFVSVAGNNTAPEPDVHVTLVPCRI